MLAENLCGASRLSLSIQIMVLWINDHTFNSVHDVMNWNLTVLTDLLQDLNIRMF